MKLGGAFYCDGCSCEIPEGSTHCNQCDPVGGVPELTHIFTMQFSPDKVKSNFSFGETVEVLNANLPELPEEKPWWKFW